MVLLLLISSLVCCQIVSCELEARLGLLANVVEAYWPSKGAIAVATAAISTMIPAALL